MVNSHGGDFVFLLLVQKFSSCVIMADVVRSEVLFTVQNNFGEVPVNNLVSVISGFYDESEIINAKTILRDVASKLTDDPDIPRLKTRGAGDNRRKLNAEDILSLFTCLDAKKTAMPLFAAVKSSRLPRSSRPKLMFIP